MCGRRFQSDGSFSLQWQQQCARTKYVVRCGRTSMSATKCFSFGTARIRDAKMETISGSLFFMSVDTTLSPSSKSSLSLQKAVLAESFRTTVDQSARSFVGNAET